MCDLRSGSRKSESRARSSLFSIAASAANAPAVDESNRPNLPLARRSAPQAIEGGNARARTRVPGSCASLVQVVCAAKPVKVRIRARAHDPERSLRLPSPGRQRSPRDSRRYSTRRLSLPPNLRQPADFSRRLSLPPNQLVLHLDRHGVGDVGAGRCDPRASVSVASERDHDLESRAVRHRRLVNDLSSVSPGVSLCDREPEAGAVASATRVRAAREALKEARNELVRHTPSRKTGAVTPPRPASDTC
jgi:hypothetical protein